LKDAVVIYQNNPSLSLEINTSKMMAEKAPWHREPENFFVI
jgi:hypothetical protein